MNPKALHILGLATRAGKCRIGDAAVLEAIRSGKAACVVVDDSASINTRKKFTDKSKHYSVPIIFLPAGGIMGDAMGKPGAKVVALIDKAFYQMLLSIQNDPGVYNIDVEK